MRIDYFGTKPYLSLILVILFIFISPGCSSLNDRSNQGVRAIWVQSEAASTPKKADDMLNRVAWSGFNTILYSIDCGTVYYHSTLLPQSPDVTSEYDPLAYVVEQGHARGLKVQAWWCPGTAPKDSSLFRDQYPEWSIASVNGIPEDFHWLNFSLPDVQQFVSDVVVEIAKIYDVDGVHLDYIRYPADCGGTACRHFFSPEDVSLTVEASYRQLKATAPDVQLTAATMSYGGKWHLQNWADWLAGEYIDYVMPMAYYDPDDTFGQGMTLEGDIERWQEFSHPERIVPGLKVFIGEGKNKVPKTSEQLLTQVKLCQTGGVKGMAIFDERSITEELLDALSSVTFSP